MELNLNAEEGEREKEWRGRKGEEGKVIWCKGSHFHGYRPRKLMSIHK